MRKLDAIMRALDIFLIQSVGAEVEEGKLKS